MNPEIKKKWAKALRSGKYKQGREILKRGTEYCCLGVLCDVVDPEGWDTDDQHHGSWSFPDDVVLERVGLAESDAESLARLNDAYELTFDEIAHFVEAL